jgi:mannose-6-phosphate isomerase-like protein (cupin superfamily)
MIGNRLVFRTWGWYLVLLNRKRFKVKLLRFNGKRRMSRQYHKFRNELWLFLTGAHKGTWRKHHKRKEHTYTGDKALVIEIQYGSKCEESDIVRL